MPSLTRAEAETRARFVEVERYTVDLDLNRGETHFRSATTVRFTARTVGDTFAELKPAVLHRVALDGHALDPALLADGRIPLTGLTAGPHELYVEADMAYSRTGRACTASPIRSTGRRMSTASPSWTNCRASRCVSTSRTSRPSSR